MGVPPHDDRPRHICKVCDVVFYQNPKIIVGCLPRWEDKILLCKRAVEPRKDFWTLPAGYMENGETLEDGAARETREEAMTEVSIVRLQSIISLPFIDQVYFLFLADLNEPSFGPGPESADVKLFKESEIPKDELAFRAIEFSLGRYFEHGDTLEVHRTSFDRPSFS